jgi:hypothetical protein
VPAQVDVPQDTGPSGEWAVYGAAASLGDLLGWLLEKVRRLAVGSGGSHGHALLTMTMTMTMTNS